MMSEARDLDHFAKSFLDMGRHLRRVQKKCQEMHRMLNEKLGAPHSTSKEALTYAVNGCVWFAAVADISQNLHKMADSMSHHCNQSSGYKVDITGDLHDLFRQQREWAGKNRQHPGSSGEGEPEWN